MRGEGWSGGLECDLALLGARLPAAEETLGVAQPDQPGVAERARVEHAQDLTVGGAATKLRGRGGRRDRRALTPSLALALALVGRRAQRVARTQLAHALPLVDEGRAAGAVVRRRAVRGLVEPSRLAVHAHAHRRACDGGVGAGVAEKGVGAHADRRHGSPARREAVGRGVGEVHELVYVEHEVGRALEREGEVGRGSREDAPIYGRGQAHLVPIRGRSAGAPGKTHEGM